MIKYNLNNINDWDFNESDITKVYRNNAVVYQKLTTGGTGVSILSPEYISRDANHTGYIPLGEYFTNDTVIDIDFQMTNVEGYCVVGDYYDAASDSSIRFFLGAYRTTKKIVMFDIVPNSRIQSNLVSNYNHNNWEIGNYYIKDLNTGTFIATGSTKSVPERPNQLYLFNMELSTPIPQDNTDYGNAYSLKILKGGTVVKDFIPWTDGNGNYGFFDKISCTIHHSIGQMTGSTNVTTVEISCPTIN